MKSVIVAVLVLFLAGCTATIRDKGADINDTALENALFTICYGASIGAVRREFQGRGATYNDLCNPPVEEEDSIIQ